MKINFERLEEISRALKSSRQSGRSFHTTFIFHKNKLLSLGCNDYRKQHPYQRFGHYKNSKYNSGNYMPGLHSECSAIIKLGIEDCRHLTFINIRIDNNDKPALSAPCANCQQLLDSVGYRKIWYYDGNKYAKYA